jgi:phosphoglycolate phosphatase-like HAD superfamily hydrolase
MPEKKVGIFDLDGTLITGSNEVILDGFKAAVAQAHGRHELKGMLNEIITRAAKDDWGTSPYEKLEQMGGDRDVYDSYLMENLPQRIEAVSGCLDTLKSLKVGGMVLGLTTATPKKIVSEIIFPHIKMPKNLFKHIETADALKVEGGKPKPDPYTINKILYAEHVKPENGVMVGDAQVDVEAGQSAGVDVIVVLTGDLDRKEAQRLGVNPDYVIDDICFLEGVLEQMGRRSS